MKNLLSALILLLFTGCSAFLYQPTRFWYSDPKTLKLDYTEETFKGRDGFQLTVWNFKSPKPSKQRSLVLFFHGNAQNVSAHYMNFAWLPGRGHDFMILDYRGYGISEGSPNQQGLHNDALDFLDYGYAQFKKGGYQRLVVYGQSMGGAVLLRALRDFPHKNAVHLAVIDSSFLSFSGIARSKLQLSFITYPFSILSPILMSDQFAP